MLTHIEKFMIWIIPHRYLDYRIWITSVSRTAIAEAKNAILLPGTGSAFS